MIAPAGARPPALLLSREQAADALGGISVRTLDAMARRGEIRHVQCGRRVLFSTDALRDWIVQQETGAEQ